MIAHLSKIMWNKRKDYIWIFFEQILVFLVLLFCFSQFMSKFEQYNHPGNLSVKNVCTVAIIPEDSKMDDDDWAEFAEQGMRIQQEMIGSGLVEAIHEGYYSVPLNRESYYNFQDSLIFNNKKYKFYIKTSDDNFPVVFKPRMIEGTWYKNEAFTDGTYPAVVTKSLVEKLEVTNPIGIKLSYLGRDFKVTGVTNDFKTMVYDDATPTAIFASSAFIDHNFEQNAEMAILVKEGKMKDFMNLFWKEAIRSFPDKAHQPIAVDMEESNRDTNTGTYINLLIIFIPTLFLIIFAFMGTFSLMYRLSKKATGEYGLRIALGCTKSNLRKMVVKQSCLLTSFAMIPGCFLAINVYLAIFSEIKISIFVISLLATIILMLLFAISSVWYPAYVASETQPAMALKQEE